MWGQKEWSEESHKHSYTSLPSLPLVSAGTLTAGSYLPLCSPLPGIPASQLGGRSGFHHRGYSGKRPEVHLHPRHAADRLAFFVSPAQASPSLLALPTPRKPATRPGRFWPWREPTPLPSPGASSLTKGLVSRAENLLGPGLLSPGAQPWNPRWWG